MADKLEQVAIRMVEQPPLYSKEPMNNPDAAIRVMNEFLSQMDRELFCIVNLQADLTPINMNIVSVGSLNEALINPREIFKSAILSNAHSMMLIHNHPSGNLTPSTSDIQTTARMQELGELMGISLVDHIITGRDGNYYSFRDKGEFPDSRIRFSTRVEDIDLTKGMVTEAIAPYEEVTDTKEKDVLILAIESSCDETAAAVVQGRTLISNVVASSMDEHARYGGVIPEIASRAHTEAFVPCVSKALADANMTLSDVDAIAVSAGPGLAGCLAVGVSGAKSLAWAANKPIYGINHVIGHIAVTQLQFGPFPKDTLALIVSGTLRCCMSKTWRGISTWSAPRSTTLPANASTRWRVCLVSRIPAARTSTVTRSWATHMPSKCLRALHKARRGSSIRTISVSPA